MARSLFQGAELAKRYLLYRPTYAKELYEFMVQYYEEGRGPDCNYHLAVDVGCGSGQATIPLAEYFHHVIGCDISKDQLSNAPKDVDRVEFKVSPSENLAFLEDNSVDIVTAATSFHWFDQELFYAEAKRVLKPGGVLSIFSWNPPVLDNTEGQKLFEEDHNTIYMDDRVMSRAQNSTNVIVNKCVKFHCDSSTDVESITKHVDFLDKYWRETKCIDTMYMDYSLPFPEWKGLFKNKPFSIRKRGLSEFIGYVTSSHAWNLYIKENPDSDHLEQLRKRMAKAYTQSDEETVLNATFSLALLIGRKPV